MKCLKCGKPLNSPWCECGYNHLSDETVSLYSLSDMERKEITVSIGGTETPPFGTNGDEPDNNNEGFPTRSTSDGDWIDTTTTTRRQLRSLCLFIVPVAVFLITGFIVWRNADKNTDISGDNDSIAIENIFPDHLAFVDSNDEDGVSGWGDSDNGRPSYTIAEVNAGVLGNTITFNSISDGKIGDEKNFVGALVHSGSHSLLKYDSIYVKDGDEYTIFLYVHNNNPGGLEAIAKDVRAYFSVPTTVSKSHTIFGILESSNASPTEYWDGLTLESDEFFYVEYVAGSAKYENLGMGFIPLSDSIVTSSGVPLGYSRFDGEIPGCYEYDGVVTIHVVVHQSVTAKLSVTARLKGTVDWSEAVWANVGDEVEYQIEYVNLTSETVNDVMIRDILPTNAEYVDGSTLLYNSYYQEGIALFDNTVATSGINIGSYAPKGNAYIRFTVKIVDNTLAEGTNQLVNWANVTVDGKVAGKDDASTLVTKSSR